MYIKMGKNGNQIIYSFDGFEFAMLSTIVYGNTHDCTDLILCDDAGSEVRRISHRYISAMIENAEMDCTCSKWQPSYTGPDTSFVHSVKVVSSYIWKELMTAQIRLKFKDRNNAFSPAELAPQLAYMSKNNENLYACTAYKGKRVIVAYASDLRLAISNDATTERFLELAHSYFACAESIYLKRVLSKKIKKCIRTNSRSL